MSLKPIDSAFPHPTLNDVGFGEEISASAGMTKRDWFAGLAMQGFIPISQEVLSYYRQHPERLAPNGLSTDATLAEMVAVESRRAADALLAELAKTEPKP